MKLQNEALAVAKMKELLSIDDDELLHDMAEGETDFMETLDYYISKVADEINMQAGIDAQMEKLKVRKAASKARQERLREAIQQGLEISEIKKAVRPQATVSLRKIADSVIIDDVDKIPHNLKSVEIIEKVKVNTAEIKKLLQSGEEIGGVVLKEAGQGLGMRFE